MLGGYAATHRKTDGLISCILRVGSRIQGTHVAAPYHTPAPDSFTNVYLPCRFYNVSLFL